LDAATGSQVIDLLVGAATYRGAAVVVVTHDNAVAARCHRALHIVDGRVGDASGVGPLAGGPLGSGVMR
jgi:putative ABC transport system ATP-binding protein